MTKNENEGLMIGKSTKNEKGSGQSKRFTDNDRKISAQREIHRHGIESVAHGKIIK
jgi:hypothetical protein